MKEKDELSKNKKERQSNIEVLRIFSILLILIFHYSYKCTYTFETFTFNAFMTKAFYMFGELGVNLFILITGYFMCKSKISLKKIILLILEIDFYYLLTAFIAILLNQFYFPTRTDFFLVFFPTILNKYWFATAYILIYILSPYFNILINNMNKKAYQKFLITILIIWCIIPTFFGFFYNNTESFLYYSRFIWLIVIYFVGAYIRLYPIKIFNTLKKSLISSIITYGLMLLSIILIQKFNSFSLNAETLETAYFWRPNTILMFLLSVSTFSIFLNIKIKNNVIINKIASTTLGIYLLHDGLLGNYIWNVIFKTSEHIYKPNFILYMLFTCLTIFIVGVVIDLIRQLIEKYIVNKIEKTKLINTLSKKISTF